MSWIEAVWRRDRERPTAAGGEEVELDLLGPFILARTAHGGGIRRRGGASGHGVGARRDPWLMGGRRGRRRHALDVVRVLSAHNTPARETC